MGSQIVNPTLNEIKGNGLDRCGLWPCENSNEELHFGYGSILLGRGSANRVSDGERRNLRFLLVSERAAINP